MSQLKLTTKLWALKYGDLGPLVCFASASIDPLEKAFVYHDQYHNIM